MLPAEYARSGLQRGLLLEKQLGTNPFKFGLVGASDNHVGLTTPDNDNFFGKFTAYEPNPERATHLSRENTENGAQLYAWQYITAGLTAVWAEENTRGAIFDAMERREVYATTGPRMRVRFFGGWDFEPADALRRDLALVGYSKGVPMGADLPAGRGITVLSRLCAARPDRRQSRSRPDRQGLDRCPRRAAGEGLRRRLVGRPRARL